MSCFFPLVWPFTASGTKRAILVSNRLDLSVRSRFPKILTCAGCLVFLVWAVVPSQEGDPAFNPKVDRPTYADRHPRIYFDAGHWNIHTADGRYQPFSELMRNDGYEIVSGKGKFSQQALAGSEVLVVANALGFRGTLQQFINILHADEHLHVPSRAFDDEECAIVREWVRQGGSLLLISDHAPAGEAASPLANAFGVGMSNWWAEEPTSHDEVTGNWGFLVFSRENRQLVDHPITRGRNPAETLHRITTFTGQSLIPPEGATSLLKLSPEAREYPWSKSPDDRFHSAANRAQAVAMSFGSGRVVVFGEAAVLTSQLARAPGREFHFGMDWPGSDNRQLALNVMHWLSHALN
jgi:hypothetical protein